MEFIPAKLCTDDPNDWYIRYSVYDPETGIIKPYKKRLGLNRIKDLKERKAKGIQAVIELNTELRSGWSPLNKPDQKKIENDKNRLNFYWWFQEKIDSHKDDPKSYYNRQKFAVNLKKLKEFRTTLSIKEVDYKFLQDYEAFLIKKGNHVNTIADNLVRIKVIMNNIVRSGDIEYHKNPFLQFKLKTKKTNKKRVTLEDIEKLESQDLSSNPPAELARDMYIFSFYLAGMRFGDICRIKKDWFKDGSMSYRMHKSEMDRKVKLMDQAIRIIEKYKDVPGEYLFDTKVDWSIELQSISNRNAYFNKMLKVACNDAEIPKISYHTARHSVADLAKKNNLDIHTIKEILGHSKVQTTEIYMKSFYEEETGNAMDKLFQKKK